MKLLLDTHVLLWWLDDHPKLRSPARQAIADRANQVYVSAASIWEVSIKEAKGLLCLSEDFDAKLAAEQFLPLAVTHHHARLGGTLPPIHKDPFDRLLVAQSQLERMSLVTQDSRLAYYGVPIIEA